MTTFFLLVMTVFLVSGARETAIVGRYETLEDCHRAAAVIDASTPLRLEFSCRELA